MQAAISPDGDGFQEVLGHGKHLRNMNELIQAEGKDSEEDHLNCPCQMKQKAKAKSTTVDDGNFFSSLSVEDDSDADDTNFSKEPHSESSSKMSATRSDNDIEEITNEEVHHFYNFYDWN